MCEYSSIHLLSADWASPVKKSASFKMIILKLGLSPDTLILATVEESTVDSDSSRSTRKHSTVEPIIELSAIKSLHNVEEESTGSWVQCNKKMSILLF